jgi:tetracycline resistance efflux pump
MQLTWVSLLPPLIVIGTVCFTHQLNVSLALGIISAALIATQGQVIPALMLCGQKFVTHFSDYDNIYLYLLLIVISSLITLLTVTGSAAGCARIIGKKMRTKRSVEMSAIMLSFLLSIDDYLSILTVGFVMRPIADRLAVARTKLAYIVHALGGPLVIIMPISTWAAAVLVQLDNAGIHLNAPNKIAADPFYVYLKTIPFIFYSVLIVFSVWFVVATRIGYGLIARDEHKAVPIKDDIAEELMSNQSANHSVFELMMPIVILMSGVIIGILYTGNYYGFGGNNSFFEAFRENSKTFFILLVSSLGAFVFSIVLSLYKKMISIVQIPAIVYEGAVLMQASIIMVALASILGSFLRLELQTGNYVAYLLLGIAPLYLIPVMLFVVSLVITLTTGSAWGTFSLLIPIATQMLISFLQLEAPVTLDQMPILFPSLGAILSGAVCGNHISPIAETTMMTATSTGIEPLEHARSQFYYVAPVIIGTLVSFVIVGLFCDSPLYKCLFVSVGAGIVTVVILMVALSYGKRQG